MANNSTLGPNEIFVDYGSRTARLHAGWVNSPNGRGTSDIIWSCLSTVVLCSWSILCLNIPSREEGWWRCARRKFQWSLLTVMGPEVIFQLSLGEWLVARRWHKKFKESGYQHWTMTHSFYANMGGFILQTTDRGSFPVNSAQLHHLVAQSYVPCPIINKEAILDKNKAAAMVRLLTLCQTLWFLANCAGRAAQGLALTTLELSTLAFISSAIGTFFCWLYKPMDVETSITIVMAMPVAEVQRRAGYENDEWDKTPLEFVDRKREWPWNIYWHYGLAFMEKKLHMGWILTIHKHRPIERIGDDYWPEPTLKSLPALFVFHVAYASILMAGWNLYLPTYTELLLWRIASSIQLGTIISAWFTMPLQIHDVVLPSNIQKVVSFFTKNLKIFRGHANLSGAPMDHWYRTSPFAQQLERRAERARTLISSDPRWRASLRLLVVYELTWLIYLFARLYIIVEDFVSLRAMPDSAFDTVNWSLYMPHI
jgi:hypothetical protein